MNWLPLAVTDLGGAGTIKSKSLLLPPTTNVRQRGSAAPGINNLVAYAGLVLMFGYMRLR